MITCRRATPEDVAGMAQIRQAGGWAGGAPAQGMARYQAGQHHPRHALEPRVMYVAEEENEMIGFIAGHLTTRFGCGGELQWLFVAPEHRGSTAATQLLRQLATWFMRVGARKVCVNVEPENARARRFYQRNGAEVLGEHWLVWNDMPGAVGSALLTEPPP